MNVKLSITGIKEIDNVLKNLPNDLSHQVLSSAHAQAAKPLVSKMQLTAPEGPTGNLVDSIGIVKTSLKRANNLGEVQVGPRRKGRYKGHAAHLVEYGTGPRATKGTGKYKAGVRRGVMTKKPFAQPAFQQTKGIVEGGISKAIGIHLNKKIKKYLKK